MYILCGVEKISSSLITANEYTETFMAHMILEIDQATLMAPNVPNVVPTTRIISINKHHFYQTQT